MLQRGIAAMYGFVHRDNREELGDAGRMTADEWNGGSDPWSQWLLHQRHSGDLEVQKTVNANVERYVQKVLDGAQLQPGQALLDVGTGEGVVAFRALERMGATLKVWLSDVSETMLQHARNQARERGVLKQCTFLRGSAEHLEGIGNGLIDVVTTRSVLAYVADKVVALREFRRVLKPGGRISLAEPVFLDDALDAQAMRKLVESHSGADVNPVMPLLHRWKAAQFPDSPEAIRRTPITSYSERDLVRLAQAAGFEDVAVELHIRVGPTMSHSWEVFINTSPHPLAPSLRQIMEQQFSTAERELLERSIRPLVEDPRAEVADRMVYLTARKPAD